MTYLKRIRVMNIKLDNLKPGEYRRIEGAEYKAVMELLKDSTGKTWAELHSKDTKANEAKDTDVNAKNARNGSIKTNGTKAAGKKINVVIRRENSGLRNDSKNKNSAGE